MKVLYIHQYFRTPKEGGSIRSYYLCRELIANDFEVEMITTHNEAFYLKKNIEGIKVHYLPISYDNKFGYLKRIVSFLKFVVKAIRLSHKIKQVDICYVMTTPLSTGLIGLYNKYIKKVPYIFEVGDLWPEVPIKMGIIKNSIIVWFLYKIERLLYAQAAGLVALSPDIASYIRNVTTSTPIAIITNISDCKFFQPISEDSKENRSDMNRKFTICYAGIIGRVTHLEYLLEIAKASKNLPIRFLVIGDGAEKAMIQNLASQWNLINVVFHEPTDKEGVRKHLRISDAIYMSFLDIKVLNTGSPNKFFDGLAAGKMIISNFGGWTKALIEKNNLGITYEAKKPYEFVEKIESILENKSKWKEFQKNSLRLAEEEYSLEILSQKHRNFIREVISDS